MLTGIKQLSEVFKKAKEIPFDNNSKIILMSDCHRSDGTWSDDFSKNQNIFAVALNYYLDNGYTYIEIGDGDELWENKDPTDIIREHMDAFWLMSKFYKLKRLYLIYGNHDMCKKNCNLMRKKYYNYYDKDKKENIPLFNNINIYEGLVLRNKENDYKIFLAHGHQVDFLNNQLWFVSRFLVRYLWKNLELFGFKDPTSAAKNYRIKNRIDKKIIAWSKEQKQMIITGHTHRPIFPSKKEPLYFNTGCCVFPRSITGIEIDKGNISLIKWSVKAKKNGILYIDKDILEGPMVIVDYFK